MKYYYKIITGMAFIKDEISYFTFFISEKKFNAFCHLKAKSKKLHIKGFDKNDNCVCDYDYSF